MFSSDDEQDRGMFDQLKCIKPFTIDQLYLLHPDVCCPPKSALSSESDQADQNDCNLIRIDGEIYQHLLEHERLRNQLINLKYDLKKLYKKTHVHIDGAWTFKEETIRKIAMCHQGNIVETTFKYKQAHIDKRHLDKFTLGFNELIEKISKDYIYYSFESQMKRNKIATHLTISYQMPELEARKSRLKSAIKTLIDFMRHLGDTKSDFAVQCRKWLRTLSRRFLEGGSTDEFRFIASQLAKGPVGTADWSADLIECKPFEQISGFESVPQYISHCSTLLSELFYNLQSRIKRIRATSAQSKGEASDIDITSQKHPDQDWSLVDPRFSCTEELTISSSQANILSESDVMKFCLRIPIAQIFRAYVINCLNSTDDFCLETDKNYEYIMLKLLTLGTIIIKTYQIGLETFNSIQYGSLIEYLSSQIRRTVLILSDQWSEFKNRLKGIDDALLMRLQVEYDSFMLRSILVILELRESGIWRHLSRIELETETQNNDRSIQGWATDSLRPAFEKILQVTGISAAQQSNQILGAPDQMAEIHQVDNDAKASRSSPTSLTYEFSVEWFKEVSEPMLWHILWQFYHNGFMSSCDYHSDLYWLEKFQEKSVVYLFVNKIRDSPPGECSYLINSITSILLSRTKHDSKLVNFIAGEIFNLTFKHKSVREKVNKKGLRSLIRCAEKFPSLISLYISLMGETNLDDSAIELIRSCSLSGWLFDSDEFATLQSWLIEEPLETPRNKLARLLLSKVLINSTMTKSKVNSLDCTDFHDEDLFQANNRTKSRRRSSRGNCFVDLKMRRKLAILLYKAVIKHYPEHNESGSMSLGASVEVAFVGAGLSSERFEVPKNYLSQLSTDSSYQQFYIWTWRLLFILRLHILNQPETDWNDVQSRSGTSRSIKNTVLINDPFHPVPSVEDTECSQLRDGLKEQNPVASFIYLVLTDATWQAATLESCMSHLNILASSGHITPSLMVFKYLIICHLNDPLDALAKDRKCADYLATIIMSNFDATRLASLIATQLYCLKQYRQLQLSHFYVRVLLEVNKVITKRVASSWFSNNEVNFEKIACLLDYIARFNFATQRLEITRKFYDCAYIVQDGSQPNRANGWLGSLINSNSIEKDLTTNLHLLSQKFKKYTWLQWINTECDAIRLEKIWEDIVAYLSGNEEATLDSAIKKVCPNINVSSLKSSLPIFSWIRQIFEVMESDLNHPLCPLIWYNFFSSYFANSLNGVSVGFKLISQETLSKLMIRLDSLYNYHIYKQKNWSSPSIVQQNSLTSLYKAYKLWLQDPSLRDAYIDIDRLPEDYLVPLLKAVMESSQADVCLQYVDIQSIETQNRNLTQVWITSTRLATNDDHLDNSIAYFDNDAGNQSHNDSMNSENDLIANDAISLMAKSYKTSSEGDVSDLNSAQEELAKPLSEDSFGEHKYKSTEELMDVVKRNFQLVFDESNMFRLNISELQRTKNEILDLVQHLYTNKKSELVRVVSCDEGNRCPGPARVKLEVEEASIDERKSQCIEDRRRQCQELVSELLHMPKNRLVQSTVTIEENVKRLISDPERSGLVVETLLKWLSEPTHYKHLNGSYYAANYILKTTLEILSTTSKVDTYNNTLIYVCLAHPESVQILSPYLSPSTCSAQCFLDLYKVICSKQVVLGPMATFVLLSKFDLSSYLRMNSKTKQIHHELIRTTCSALKEVEKNRDDSYELTLDLFKRHLQIELSTPSRRQPDEYLLVLREFLPIMSERVLAPNLWLDYLTMMGLEVNIRKTKNAAKNLAPAERKDLIQMMLESNVTVESIAEDVARFSETQLIFDNDSAIVFMTTIGEYMKQMHSSHSVTLLELYQDYIEQFGIVMLSATFIWLRSACEMYPDDHLTIWRQFLGLWNDWLFLTKNCQNINKSKYSLIASYFVVSLRYMMHKIPRNTCAILQSTLFELTNYVLQTREVIHLELTIFQRSLKNLLWSSLIATPSDIGNLAALSEQNNYNVSDLVSHIVTEMNTKESLTRIQHLEPAILAHVVERLATIIVLHSNYLKGYKMNSRYFNLIPVDDIPRLADLILSRSEFNNLDHSHSKLLMKLLRYVCICPTDASPINCSHGSQDRLTKQTADISMDDKFKRSVIYARFMSNYLKELIKRHPEIASHNAHHMHMVINDSLIDLEPMLSSQELGVSQKTTLYSSLLECCSCDNSDEASRLLLAKSIVESQFLRNKPKLVIELVQAIGQFVRDSRVLVLMVETLVELYRNINGRYERVWTNFNLCSIPEEKYLTTCVEERAQLALMVYFESLFSASNQIAFVTNGSTPASAQHQKPLTTNQIWSKYFLWLAKLIQSLCNIESSGQLGTSKLTTAWVRILAMFETNLEQYLLGHTRKSGIEGSRGLEREEDGKSDEKQKEATIESSETDHKSLLNFIKQLISFYDSINTGGLWSYLKSSTKSGGSYKISVTALSIACFLADRALIYLNEYLVGNSSSSLSSTASTVPAYLVTSRDELVKLLRFCLSKLEAARKSKSLVDSAQFIETLIASIQQHEKVQYNEGVQLIKTYARAQ